MRRVLLGVFSCCLLASLAFLGGPAKAGDYSGYRQTYVWYTSSCCYRKVVRHVTTIRTTSRVRYVRIHRDYVPYRYGYDRQPYRYYRSRRYDVVRYVDDRGYWRRPSYRYANVVPAPDCRLIRVANLDGTWDWTRRAGCF